MEHRPAILAAVALAALGAMFYNLLPLFVGVAQDFRELDNRSVGVLSSMFFTGYTLAASSAFFWIRRINWQRVTMVALLIGGVALSLAAFAPGFALLTLWIFIAGAVFAVVYGIATTALGDTSEPARWYGLKISVEAMLGAVLLFILPRTLVLSYGFAGLMMGMVLVVLLCAPALHWLPPAGAKHSGLKGRQTGIPARLRCAVWIGLFAAMMFVFSATMIWTFLERMANSAGLEAVLIGKILSLTLVFAMLGSLAAMLLGNRFGSGKPFAAATVIFLLALIFLSGFTSIARFAAGSCLLTLAIGLGITYTITIVANLDADGRYVVLTVPAIGIGVTAAPAIGGLLVSAGEFSAVLWVCSVTVVLALSAGLIALHRGTRSQSAL